MNGREKRTLAGMLGREVAARVVEIVEETLPLLLARRSHEGNHALDVHRTTMILPAVALQSALESNGFTRDEARSTLTAYYRTMFMRSRWIYETGDRLPFFYALIRSLLRRAMASSFPEAGWRRHWVEDSATRMAFTMESCYYLATLREYGREDLLPIFCGLDELVYGAMSRHVAFRRSTTLARGGFCDFAFINVKGRGNEGLG